MTVAMDLTTLLQQDGKSAEAVAVFEKAAKADPPDYALLAATRAYRDLRRYDDAPDCRRLCLPACWPDGGGPQGLSAAMAQAAPGVGLQDADAIVVRAVVVGRRRDAGLDAGAMER
jgi:hypothetical protein